MINSHIPDMKIIDFQTEMKHFLQGGEHSDDLGQRYREITLINYSLPVAKDDKSI